MIRQAGNVLVFVIGLLLVGLAIALGGLLPMPTAYSAVLTFFIGLGGGALASGGWFMISEHRAAARRRRRHSE